MNRRDFLKRVSMSAATLCGARAWGQAADAAEQPNILLIIADDTTITELGCYGGSRVPTPNIDNLAAEGLRFRRAYVAMAMCVPCRHELYTGLYPMGSGACWNHSTSRDGTKSICHYLGGLGYRVGLTGKCHAEPDGVFPFERIKGFQPFCVHKKPVSRADTAGIAEFMTRRDSQPFCLAVGLVDSHIPWTTGAPEQFDRAAVDLPPTLPDLPEVRNDYVKYLAEVAELDRNAGVVLKALEDAGKRNNTLVIFTSEQGAQWPGAKWTNWEAGLRTGFICRWPGRIAAGDTTDALVQYADVLPTLIEAAGGKVDDLDGASFLDVLLGKSGKHREYAYAMHNNIAAGPPYPIRSVTDGRLRYIRNLLPETEFIQKHMEESIHRNGHVYWQAWKAAAKEPGRARELFLRFRKRPAEELYDTAADPKCLHNLAEDEAFSDAKQRLSRKLDAWMEAEGDPGAALDTQEAFYPRSLRKLREDRKKTRKRKAGKNASRS